PEYRMMHPRQRARSLESRFLGLNFFLLVGLGESPRHRFEIEAVFGIGRVLQVNVLELLQEEGHALKSVAAVAVAAVREKSDHGLVDLDSARRLWAIGRYGSLGTKRGNRARSVGDQKADQNLERPRLRLGRLLSGQGQKQEISHRPAAE